MGVSIQNRLVIDDVVNALMDRIVRSRKFSAAVSGTATWGSDRKDSDAATWDFRS